MVKVRNPWKKLTEAEKSQRMASQREIQDKIKALAETGKKCLAHPDFAKYKEEHLALREFIISEMKNCPMGDPVQYAFFMNSCVSKLTVVDLLLESVEHDAGRKV